MSRRFVIVFPTTLFLVIYTTSIRSFVPIIRKRQRTGSNSFERACRTVEAMSCSTLSMVDKSCVTTFSLGDRVRVVNDVYKAGINLRGYVGTVVETWEKCDVDPTCCCAEFVDDGYAVRVEFQSTLPVQGNISFTSTFIQGISDWRHYFSEEEIHRV